MSEEVADIQLSVRKSNTHTLKSSLSLPPTGVLKKELAQLNNQVSQEMYGIGVKKQKVEIMGDKIVIFTEQKRIPALAILDGKYGELTLSVDAALVREFKERLKNHVEMQFGLKVRSILKDYDPGTEAACIVILLDRNLV
ncbi:Uncharacterized conserved protein [Marininema mesophilum]|uniref:Uncharacterized conserved protein n=1 Tax=Marininema mesophilum TaxID=1048340 RepID=A0A1H2QUI3_9BACL|nr:Na-translocating system protein MpsC family protein [Marininema mesophilum]SDW10826.1 Uncharacterized conserved protein [Marininema mesophilum]